MRQLDEDRDLVVDEEPRPLHLLARLSRSVPLVTFATIFTVLATWAIVTPMYATPDEPAHMVRSAGVVRGQVEGEVQPNGRTAYRVPSTLNSEPGCYAFKQDTPADCLSIPADTGEVLVPSSASSYPPLFHALVGWPTRVDGGLSALYGMRLANAAVAAAFFALAVVSIRGLPNSGVVVGGLVVATTPMVLFLSGPVNPSGMTTMAGLATWAGGFALSNPRTNRALSRSAALFGLPLCALLLLRRDSLLWGSAILVSLVPLLNFARIRVLVKSRAVWSWGAACLMAALAQYFLWTADNASSFADGAEATTGGNLDRAWGDMFEYLRQAIGKMGWLDTPVPSAVSLVYLGLIIGLLVAGFFFGSIRPAVASFVVVILVVALSVGIGWVRWPYLQGRYFLPLAVGVPMLASYSLSQSASVRRVTPRVVLTAGGLLFLLQMLAYVQHLRRYVVGYHGSWRFLLEGGAWHPPIGPPWFAIVLYAAVLGGLYAWMAKLVLGSTEPSSETRLAPVPVPDSASVSD